MKKILIALIVSMLMSVTASAGMVEVKAAYVAEDYTLCSSEAAKVIADSKAVVNDKASAQLYIGYCYYRQKDFAKALPEFQKVISDYPEVVKQCAVAQRRIGYCYEKLGKVVEAQSAFVQVCKIQGASLSPVTSAFSKIDKVALGKVEYLKLIDTMLLVIPATAANAEFLGVLKSEQEKLK